MEKFEKLTAVAAPMPASNIDTDIIMPKAFLNAYRQGRRPGRSVP